jgi:hypothetical protein
MTKYRSVRIEKRGKTIAWRVFQVDQFGTNAGDISDHETERGARAAIKRYEAADRRRPSADMLPPVKWR